eukprot:Rmarinus@m.1261
MNESAVTVAARHPPELDSACALVEAQSKRFKNQYAQFISLLKIQQDITQRIHSQSGQDAAPAQAVKRATRLPKPVYEALAAAFDQEKITKENAKEKIPHIVNRIRRDCNFEITTAHALTYFQNRATRTKQLKTASLLAYTDGMGSRRACDTKSMEQQLVAILDPQGYISNTDNMTKFIKLLEEEKTPAGRTMLCGVLKRTENEAVLEHFVERGGIRVVRDWLTELREGDNRPMLVEALSCLRHVPVTVAILRETGIGKIINKLQKHKESRVHSLAKELFNSWKEVADHQKKLAAKQKVKTEVAPKQKTMPLQIPKRPSPTSTVPVALDDSSLFGKKRAVPPKRTQGTIKPDHVRMKLRPVQSLGYMTPDDGGNKVGGAENPPTIESFDAFAQGSEVSIFANRDPNRKRKKVSWAKQDSLKQVRVFFKGDEVTAPPRESDAATGEHRVDFSLAKKREHSDERAHIEKEREAKRRRISQMSPTIPWRTPDLIDLPVPDDEKKIPRRGQGSVEKNEQAKRVQSVLAAVYFDRSKIPPTPHEPDTLPKTVDDATIKVIPVSLHGAEESTMPANDNGASAGAEALVDQLNPDVLNMILSQPSHPPAHHSHHAPQHHHQHQYRGMDSHYDMYYPRPQSGGMPHSGGGGSFLYHPPEPHRRGEGGSRGGGRGRAGGESGWIGREGSTGWGTR